MIDAARARVHFASLLDKTTQGEEVLITRRGVPIARFIPEGQAEREMIERTIETLRAVRSGLTLDGIEWKDL